jgi:pectin methylesterase-like acyl-CoA thioesterase
MDSFILNEISPDNLFIQNKVVNDGKTYEARTSVTLGRDVTNAYPEGDVDFIPGANVTVRAGKKIILAPGFKTLPGVNASFRIEPFVCE